jgi:ketosteroid isomerase-like protein
MADHPNVLRAREYLTAYASGDVDNVAPYFAEDIVWHVGGKHGLSGTYRGRDDVLNYLRTAGERSGGTLLLEPEAILADDDHLAIFMHVRGDRGGKHLDATMTEIVELGEDGTWKQFFALSEHQDAIDDFWA